MLFIQTLKVYFIYLYNFFGFSVRKYNSLYNMHETHQISFGINVSFILVNINAVFNSLNFINVLNSDIIVEWTLISLINKVKIVCVEKF